ncbi:mCpol domain-containing protein [Vibrio coralliirubri]|uniref:mCpol domain-containing protein n=1 Tax=Vibrio coralliirubri TaxID=1516159 RepID=UPI002FD28A25
MKYISIDGDDVGRKITACYLSNNEKKLELISTNLEKATVAIAELLSSKGFDIIFRAADGVVAKTEYDCNFTELFLDMSLIPTYDITFSAGVGETLREAYVALLSSKSNGKNRISIYAD